MPKLTSSPGSHEFTQKSSCQCQRSRDKPGQSERRPTTHRTKPLCGLWYAFMELCCGLNADQVCLLLRVFN